MPGIDTSTAWSWAMIASWRSGVGREPTIASATFGPTPVTVSSSVKNPRSSARPEAVQRLLVLADEVVGVELERRAGHGGREDRRRREHPVADPADLDDERIERDGADAALDRGDHAARSRLVDATRRRASTPARRPWAPRRDAPRDGPVVGGVSPRSIGGDAPPGPARRPRALARRSARPGPPGSRCRSRPRARRPRRRASAATSSRRRAGPSGRPAPCRPRRSPRPRASPRSASPRGPAGRAGPPPAGPRPGPGRRRSPSGRCARRTAARRRRRPARGARSGRTARAWIASSRSGSGSVRRTSRGSRGRSPAAVRRSVR